ncbi:MAG: ribonuclease III [Candidatus Bipolaricaulia bacterium]
MEFAALNAKLGLEIKPEELSRAFAHSSYANESPEPLRSNERLEFLGDAVIALSVSAYLFERLDGDEGKLTQIKSVVVSEPVLADAARTLSLDRYLLLGKGEEKTGGRDRPSILAATFEALVGLIFSKTGYRRAAEFVIDVLQSEIDRIVDRPQHGDYKSLLQELTVNTFGKPPVYRLLDEQGAEHRKVFTVEVEVDQLNERGRGRRIKEAEQAAAKRAYLKLKKLKGLR